MEHSNSLKKLNTFSLKIIGVVLMVIDHFYEIFSSFGVPSWVDWFGRPVPLIFFFVSVIGFTHTRNQEKYLLRLLLGFWLMNIGNLIVFHFFEFRNQAITNNIFSDLFLAVLTMYGIKKISENKKLLGIGIIIAPIAITIVLLALVSAGQGSEQMGRIIQLLLGIFPNLLNAEYNVLFYLAVILYIFRKSLKLQVLAIVVVSAIYFVLGQTQWVMVFAIIPILLYNGEKGKGMKYFFYIFYPAHIWLFYIIASVLSKGY